MALETSELKIEVGCEVRGPSDDLDYGLVDRVREAIMPVLQRHGYEVPGIADLCAVAAVREMTADAIVVRTWAKPV